MSAKRTFVDSNIILYLFTDERKEFVNTLFTPEYRISTQVVNENVNVCIRKLKISKQEAYAHGTNLLNSFTVALIHPSTITRAFELSVKYGFSHWDSLIVATALEQECEVLFSEDMQHGQLIEKTLRVEDPFKKI